MKALIMTWEKFQDHEVIYPYYRVQEDGFEVDIMSNIVGKIFGILERIWKQQNLYLI